MTAEMIVCPHCAATNRVPAERLAETPHCGSCKRQLFTPHPHDVTSAVLAKMIARTTLPIVVDFWAPWCAPCRSMAPAYAAAAAKLVPHALCVKLDTEAQGEAGAAHRIQSIPTIAAFHGGREIARRAGALPESAIIAWAREAIGAG